jgi:hypothetical protein
MCFVEFEDVNYAQNAIQHLYGHSLVSSLSSELWTMLMSRTTLSRVVSDYPTRRTPWVNEEQVILLEMGTLALAVCRTMSEWAV